MGFDYCAPGSGPGCSDSVVVGVVISKSVAKNGERKLIVDTGQADLRVFVTKEAPDIAEGTHVYIRIAWIDEFGNPRLWVTCIENNRTRLTLCVNGDIENFDGLPDDILVAPSTISIGAVSVLADMRAPLPAGLGSLREMLVVSPALDSSIRRQGE